MKLGAMEKSSSNSLELSVRKASSPMPGI